MAYNQQSSKPWFSIKAIYETIENQIKYRIANKHGKIEIHQKRIEIIRNNIKQLDAHRKNAFYKIDSRNEHSPLVSIQEKNEYNKTKYQPLFKKFTQEAQKEELAIKRLEKAIEKKKQPSPPQSLAEKPDIKSSSSQNSPSAVSKPNIVEVSKPNVFLTVNDKIQKYYPLQNFYSDVGKTFTDYQSLSKANQKGLLQTYINQLDAPNIPEKQKLYLSAVVQKIEQNDNKIYYANGNADEIIMNSTINDSFISNYMEYSLSKQVEIKNSIQNIRLNPNNYPSDLVQKVEKLHREISLLEARQHAQKVSRLLKKTENNPERKRSKKR